MNYQTHFSQDSQICGGETVIKGTRVPIKAILASLAEGAKVEDIVADFPTLTEENVWAVIAFAASSAEEDMPLREIPKVA